MIDKFVGGNINVTPNVAFLLTLRNSGYNNYTAIEDIIDNAFDTDVNANNVKIQIKQKSKEKEYESITICDDGCGMNYETILEAFKLGAMTGKDKTYDLGSYGTGLKAAALSMGRKFQVKTKAKDDEFYIIDFDLDEMLSKDKYEIPVRIGTEEEYLNFSLTILSTTGTMITLSKLDNLINTDKYSFRNTLSEKLGLTYNIFINEFKKNIYVDDQIVTPFDPMLRHLPETTPIALNEKFDYNGNELRFSIYNIEPVSETRSREIGRNKPNAGMYIYRNNRLVGRALDLGIVGLAADGYGNGLRVELFMNGDYDELFGSTFNKIIAEKNRNEINQSFRDTCNNIIGTYTRSIMNLEKAKAKANRRISDDVINQQNAIFDTINKNKFVDVDRKGINHKKETPTEKPEPSGITRTFKGRKRNDMFTNWEMDNLGETGPIFVPYKKGKLYIIKINQDHALWTHFLNEAPMDVKAIFNMYFVAQAIGLEKTTYYEDDDKTRLMDEYNLHLSEQLRLLITR